MTRVKVISNEKNLGFPAAVNQGLKAASGSYFLIANNDIIVTESWLERMIEAADRDTQVGIVGPISNSVSGVQIDKEADYSTIEEMHKYAGEVSAKNKNQEFVFPRVAFLCTLIKKEVVDKIGGLDERFSPGNFEDDDFCLRAQLSGYKTIVVKDVFIHHFGSKSFSAEGVEKYQERLDINKQIFIDKWNSDPDGIWLRNEPVNRRSLVYHLNNNSFLEYFQRANNLLQENDYEFALQNLTSAIEFFDENSAREMNISFEQLNILTGNIALIIEDQDRARYYFETALEANPKSSKACAGLAKVFLKEDEVESAKIMLEWAVMNDPENNSAAAELSKVNKALGFPGDHISSEDIETEKDEIVITKN